MGEEQRYLRFILPGLMLPLSLTAALALTSPWLVAHLVDWASRTTATSFAAAAGTLLSTGGLGFLFAQLYFGLRNARPDHTVTFEEYDCPPALEQMLGDSWRQAAGKAELKESLWLQFLLWLTADTPLQGRVRRRHRRLVQREHAWDLAHFLWQVWVAPKEHALTRDVSRLAARLAALGTTVVGLGAALVGWIGWILYVLVRSEPHTWLPDGQAELCVLGAAIALVLVFLIPMFLLLRSLRRLKRYHTLAIHAGLVRRWPERQA